MKFRPYWPPTAEAYQLKTWHRADSFENLTAHKLIFNAKMLVCGLFNSESLGVFIAPDEVGVWGDFEHPHLLAAVVGHANQDDLLGEFAPDERDAAISYIYVLLTFGWGLAAWTASGDRAVRIDHDGRFASHNLPDGPLQAILNLLGPPRTRPPTA